MREEDIENLLVIKKAPDRKVKFPGSSKKYLKSWNKTITISASR